MPHCIVHTHPGIVVNIHIVIPRIQGACNEVQRIQFVTGLYGATAVTALIAAFATLATDISTFTVNRF